MTDKEKADQAATLGHYVRVYSPSHELGLSFPPLAIKGLALELVGMLREVLPALEVSVDPTPSRAARPPTLGLQPSAPSTG